MERICYCSGSSRAGDFGLGRKKRGSVERKCWRRLPRSRGLMEVRSQYAGGRWGSQGSLPFTRVCASWTPTERCEASGQSAKLACTPVVGLGSIAFPISPKPPLQQGMIRRNLSIPLRSLYSNPFPSDLR